MKKRLSALALFALGLVLASGAFALPIDLSGGMPVREEAYRSETEYEDPTLSVKLTSTRFLDTDCYIARVRIADASQLRTAPAYDFSRNQTAPATAIAERVNAVLAVNGDYYAYQMATGSVLLRQGQLYANHPLRNRELLILDEQGDMNIVLMDENGYPPAEIDLTGVVNVFNFGPALVLEGKRLSDAYRQNFNDSAKKHRRCAIGQVKRGTLEYVCVVTDGPEERGNKGLTIPELAQLMESLGVETAYNLDGGNSTVMLFHGEKVNAIQQRFLRPISDIIYFASADESAGEAEK